jgi:hypothetical protein
MCKKYCGGERLWKWVMKIGALKGAKIGWDASLDDPDTETNIITVDGTDFRTWEVKHPLYNQDKLSAHRSTIMLLKSLRSDFLFFVFR